MPIVAKASGSAREPVPMGNHIARCYRVLEIGTVETNYQGKIRQIYKIRIAWELPNTTHVFDAAVGPQPFVTDMHYSLSMNSKASLRKDVESWLGRPLTEQELAEGFDITTLVGMPCMLNIVHTPEGYDRINAITPLPVGIECPPPVNPAQVISYDSPAYLTEVAKLPEWLQKEIMGTPEYLALTGQVPTGPSTVPQMPPPPVPVPQPAVPQTPGVPQPSPEPGRQHGRPTLDNTGQIPADPNKAPF